MIFNAHSYLLDQLSRLHMILKPFMLRRVKKEVENELGEKVEKEIMVDLSARQRRIYRGIRDKIPISELLEKTTSSESSLDSLMNLVMQFRKVCNHPELFERAETKAPVTMTRIPSLSPWWREPASATSAPGHSSKEPRYIPVYGNALRNPISFEIPKLVYRECMMRHVSDCSVSPTNRSLSLVSIYEPSNICAGMAGSDSFSFVPFIGASPAIVSKIGRAALLDRFELALEEDRRCYRLAMYSSYSGSRLLHSHLFQVLLMFSGPLSRLNQELSPTLRYLMLEGGVLSDVATDFCLRRMHPFFMEKARKALC